MGASDYGLGDDFALFPNGFAEDPSITFLQSRFSSASGLAFPNGNNPIVGYFGGNFQIAAAGVPELDSSSAMMPIRMAVLLLLGSRRRRGRVVAR